MKIFVGFFQEKSVNHAHNDANNGVKNHNLNVPKQGLKQRFGRVDGGKEDGNCLHLQVAWSVLINGFIHGFPRHSSLGVLEFGQAVMTAFLVSQGCEWKWNLMFLVKSNSRSPRLKKEKICQ